MNQISSGKRDIAIDMAKGVAIILMVLGHACPGASLFDRVIHVFHMPLFFIVSGYLFCDANVMTVAKKFARRLLVPLVIVSLTAVFIFWLAGDMDSMWERIRGFLYPENVRLNDLFFNKPSSLGPMWFLAAMFWCRIFFLIIYHHCKKYWLLLSLVLSFSAAYLGSHICKLPFGTLIGLVAVGFYALGYKAKLCQWEKKQFPIIFCILFCIYVIIFPKYVGFYMYNCIFDVRFLPLCFFNALFSTYIIYKVCGYCSQQSTVITNTLSWCGFHSLSVLCIHTIVRDMYDCATKINILENSDIRKLLIISLGTLTVVVFYHFVIKKIKIRGINA